MAFANITAKWITLEPALKKGKESYEEEYDSDLSDGKFESDSE